MCSDFLTLLQSFSIELCFLWAFTYFCTATLSALGVLWACAAWVGGETAIVGATLLLLLL